MNPNVNLGATACFREFTYVNAGHNPPLLFRRRGRDIGITRLATGGVVVGLLEDVPYQQEVVTLEPGDILVAFTDGISEAVDPAQEEWGVIEETARLDESYTPIPLKHLASCQIEGSR